MSCHEGKGILRCLTCGHEEKDKGTGFYLFKPKHCDAVMKRLTPDELAQEKDYWERLEAEQQYIRSVGE